MDKSLFKAAEDALSYSFQIGYEEAIRGLKSFSLYFVETVLKEVSQRGALDDLFKENLEKLPKCSTIMDTFKTSALTSSRLVRPGAKFIRAKIEMETHLGNNNGKEHELLLLSPATSPSASGLSKDVKLRRLAQAA